ncbi:MAG: Ig-like domain-containing protein [Candidatus Pacebacteria bacterium]|nr:Ig-like domain-containing protein [Candidatus Paceibacterota bacterium]
MKKAHIFLAIIVVMIGILGISSNVFADQQILTSMIIQPGPVTLSVGEKGAYTVYPLDQNGNPFLERFTVTWESLIPTVATINNSGLIKGISSGIATMIVTVTSGNFTPIYGVVPVYVTSPEDPIPTTFKISPSQVSIKIGKTQMLKISVLDQDGDRFTGNLLKMFVSYDRQIAIADGQGIITGISAGNTGIFVVVTDGIHPLLSATVDVIVRQ